MKVVKGNVLDAKADLIVVTCNGTVTNGGGGRLVMGRGAAKAANEKWPGLADTFGRLLKASRPDILVVNGFYLYGYFEKPLLEEPKTDPAIIGILQVKLYWGDSAEIGLIAYSLCRLVAAQKKHHEKVALNYPGIGLGRLTKSQVRPLLTAFLDDRFTVYELPEAK